MSTKMMILPSEIKGKAARLAERLTLFREDIEVGQWALELLAIGHLSYRLATLDANQGHRARLLGYAHGAYNHALALSSRERSVAWAHACEGLGQVCLAIARWSRDPTPAVRAVALFEAASTHPVASDLDELLGLGKYTAAIESARALVDELQDRAGEGGVISDPNEVESLRPSTLEIDGLANFLRDAYGIEAPSLPIAARACRWFESRGREVAAAFASPSKSLAPAPSGGVRGERGRAATDQEVTSGERRTSPRAPSGRRRRESEPAENVGVEERKWRLADGHTIALSATPRGEGTRLTLDKRDRPQRPGAPLAERQIVLTLPDNDLALAVTTDEWGQAVVPELTVGAMKTATVSVLSADPNEALAEAQSDPNNDPHRQVRSQPESMLTMAARRTVPFSHQPTYSVGLLKVAQTLANHQVQRESLIETMSMSHGNDRGSDKSCDFAATADSGGTATILGLFLRRPAKLGIRDSDVKAVFVAA